MTKKLTADNCLAATYPAVAAQWSDRNELTPFDVFPGSGNYAWFKCPAGVHDDAWVIINSRRTGIGCNECGKIAGRLPKVGQSLGDLYPNLLAEWSDSNTLNPFQLHPKSAQRAFWKCELGHEWETQVHIRSNGFGCPFCARTALLPENSFAVQRPHLVAQWHPDNGTTPDLVSVFSGYHALWRCDTCGYEWGALVSTRSLGSRCAGGFPTGTSFEEALVLCMIQEIMGIQMYHDVRLASRLVTDGFISEYNVAIDYDGVYWHGADGSLEQDIRKSKRVTDLGYRMIRIRPAPLSYVPGAENVSISDGSTFAQLALATAELIAPSQDGHTLSEAGFERACIAAQGPTSPRQNIAVQN